MLKDLNYTKYDFPLTSPTTKKYKYFKFVVNAIQSSNTLQMSELILDYNTCNHQWEDIQGVHEATCTEVYVTGSVGSIMLITFPSIVALLHSLAFEISKLSSVVRSSFPPSNTVL